MRWFLAIASLALALAPSLLLAQAPTLLGCPIFPSDNVWNARVDSLPLNANSAMYVNSIGASSRGHAEFGSDPGNGIPWVVVPPTQPQVNVTFNYASDPGPYPIPPNPPIEGGSDRHVLIIDGGNCILYELFSVDQQSDGSWSAGSGAIFPLLSDQAGPEGWSSADAAGLPIFPGLVRYDEVATGHIDHALRFTAPATQQSYIWPARQWASNTNNLQNPPMGLRVRLKQSFDISSFGPNVQVILQCLKTYGMILSDNGAAWFITGAPDSRWNDDELHQLTLLVGSDFEAVDESSLMVDPNSNAVNTNGPVIIGPIDGGPGPVTGGLAPATETPAAEAPATAAPAKIPAKRVGKARREK